MQYFNFWAKARKEGPEFPVVCWGYSNESVEAALAMAEHRVDEAVAKLADPEADRKDYYSVDPLRERVIEEITDRDQVVAVVTRNAYGALVLNTANVAFLDIDIVGAKKRRGFVSLWKKLTGDDAEEQLAAQLSHIRDILAAAEEVSGKIYQTANGFRILITSGVFDPEDEYLQVLMEHLGVDDLYQKLCLRQKCFRARLTPKPWRIGLPRPPVRYPLVGEYSRVYQGWLEKYEARSKKVRVCRFLESFGQHPVCPEAELILKLHDCDLADDSHKLA